MRAKDLEGINEDNEDEDEDEEEQDETEIQGKISFKCNFIF